MIIGLFSALISMASHAVSAVEDAASRLIVRLLDDRIELSVPVSRLTLVFPRGDLESEYEQGTSGATASPRYFRFYDRKRGLVVSGWFEPASSYSGFEKFWTNELIALKKSGVRISKPPDVVEAAPWQAAAYDVDLPAGPSANVRAELISADTWVDVHISVTNQGTPAEAREQAVLFLKSIVSQVRQ